jgi:OmcA/MtrC family decaheme c-type cytochrome
MSHRITSSMKVLVSELHELAVVVDRHVATASPGARDEWVRVCERIPRRIDLDREFGPISSVELEELKAKVGRFAEILREHNQGRREESAMSKEQRPGAGKALIATAVLGALLGGAACSGNKGAVGPGGTNGDAGTSCTVVDNKDGTATIKCTDGTSATVKSGANGMNGANSVDGSNGDNGTACTLTTDDAGGRTIDCGDAGIIPVPSTVVDYAQLNADELAAAQLSAVITNIEIPADGQPLISMKITERHGYGVKNLSTTAATWRFALLKLAAGVNSSTDDTWVSYLAPNDHTAASSETAAAASLTDNHDGMYVYRFAKVINGGPTTAGTTYEPDKTHRLIVLLYATNNPFSPINLVKDFVPSTGADVTGQNDKVDGNACLECHTTFRAITGGTGAFGSGEFHGGVRYDIRTCVGCHNDQRRFSATGTVVTEPTIAADGTWTGPAAVLNDEAVINLPVFIHKIHMGTKLTMTGGTYAGVPQPFDTTYPQDVRNCTKCHRAPAPLADNWKTHISKRACGACHDAHSFDATVPPGRVMHSGGPQPDEKNCTVCHTAGAIGHDTPTNHLPVSLPDAHNIFADATAAGNGNTNAAFVAAAGAVPPGANVISYVVSSVSTWTDATAGTVLRPQIVFKIQLDGKDVVFPDPTTAAELIPNFAGSPSAYFVFAAPQDGKTAPADFNASASAYLRNVWNGTGTCSNAAATTTRTGGGTLTGPDAMGFYTLKVACAIVPPAATMLTGGIGYTYALGSRQTPPNADLDFVNNTQPFTQINLTAYPYTPNKKADGVTNGYGGTGGLIVPPKDVSMVATGFTARRQIVDNTHCDSCHVSLGVGPDFHAGQRNDSPTCNWCHRPNQTSSAWSANQKDFIHSIHAADLRTVPFSWHEASPTDGFFNTTYPGVLNECEMCHLPGTYDFSSDATTSAYPNMLASTVGQGTYAAGSVHSPYVAEATNYGAGYSFNALTGVSVEAAPTTLVVSPIVAACSACHDSAIAIDHMQTNGGSFYEPRSTAFTKPQQEECLLCHGPGRIASISEQHMIMP